MLKNVINNWTNIYWLRFKGSIFYLQNKGMYSISIAEKATKEAQLNPTKTTLPGSLTLKMYNFTPRYWFWIQHRDIPSHPPYDLVWCNGPMALRPSDPKKDIACLESRYEYRWYSILLLVLLVPDMDRTRVFVEERLHDCMR